MLRRVPSTVLAVALGASALAGCSTGSTEATDAPEAGTTSQVDADAFPVTIKHAFGETTIEEEPTRVATLGWSDQDAALSLGVVPVGATKLTWGGNATGDLVVWSPTARVCTFHVRFVTNRGGSRGVGPEPPGVRSSCGGSSGTTATGSGRAGPGSGSRTWPTRTGSRPAS